MPDRALLERWRAHDLESVSAALKRGGSLDDGPFGRHEGRIDLRGLPLPQPTRTGRRWDVERDGFAVGLIEIEGRFKIEHTELRELDLSGARLGGLWLFDVAIEGCRFDDADCFDWAQFCLTARDTSFRGADLRSTSFGPWTRPRPWRPKRANVYERVDFSHADLRDSFPGDGVFTDCDFSHATIDGWEFHGPLTRCRFAGRLREVRFYGTARDAKVPPNRMEGVDLSDAELEFGVDFREVDLATVKFPAGPGHIVVEDNYPCVLRRAIERLRCMDQPEARPMLVVLEDEDRRRDPANQRRVYGTRGLEGAEAALWNEVIAAAIADCHEQPD